VTTARRLLTKTWGLLPFMLLVVVGAGCADEQAGCPDAQRVAEDVAVPADTDLTRYGTLTRFDAEGGFTAYRVHSRRSVEELFVPITRQLRHAGWDLVGSENEGVDAEIYLSQTTGETAAVRLNELDCGDAMVIEVSVNRAVEGRTPSGAASTSGAAR